MFLLALARLVFAEEICNIDRPVSAEELRQIMDSCEIPVGTFITVRIEEDSPQPTKPGIGFKPNDIEINQNGKEVLDGVAGIMLIRKNLYVKVVGYADAKEQGDLLDLSYRRADAAAKYIVTKGIDSARIIKEAGGAERPVDSTDTAEGHARNRRVEFVLSVPKLAE